ncbi:hypothetical protein WICMUC_005394 [Wickerhamomyces mucosus]|uniref:Uncharacterized protein n=1 Tax=Wickerhamomyces mucosus TaxID=1378264 RepID=A0A9P8P928_9ASCO|nr:hypothetical protein WICMUC_005394 [Wickerhamomyces mucosus]
MKELRYIYQQFGILGDLIYYKDYFTKAGFKHHAGRSMAIYQISNLKSEKEELRKSLEEICGLPLLSDFEKLGTESITEVIPYFKISKLTQDEKRTSSSIEISHATLYDPFFRINNLKLVGNDTTKLKIDGNFAIPMSIKTQDLT